MACDHVYHGECLRKYFESEIGSNHFPLHCPEVACKAEVDGGLLIELLTVKQMELFTFRTFIHAMVIAPDISFCLTPDCPYAFIFDERCTTFSCPICNKSYCLSCKEKNHDGMSCVEYRVNFKHDPNDQLFQDFVKNNKY